MHAVQIALKLYLCIVVWQKRRDFRAFIYTKYNRSACKYFRGINLTELIRMHASFVVCISHQTKEIDASALTPPSRSSRNRNIATNYLGTKGPGSILTKVAGFRVAWVVNLENWNSFCSVFRYRYHPFRLIDLIVWSQYQVSALHVHVQVKVYQHTRLQLFAVQRWGRERVGGIIIWSSH